MLYRRFAYIDNCAELSITSILQQFCITNRMYLLDALWICKCPCIIMLYRHTLIIDCIVENCFLGQAFALTCICIKLFWQCKLFVRFTGPEGFYIHFIRLYLCHISLTGNFTTLSLCFPYVNVTVVPNCCRHFISLLITQLNDKYNLK